MRIESLHIDKFGGLRGFDLNLEDGLTIVRGPNESGKSTVLAFIRAMLYGLNGKSASLLGNDRRRYMPWGETSMGGSLRLSDGRSQWEIARVFGHTRKADTLRVVDLSSGEILPIPVGEEPGKTLLGIDEALFSGALFLSSRGSRPESGGLALTEKVKNLVSTGAEDVDLNQVVERLRAAKNEISPRLRDRGTLNAVRAELDRARRALMDSERVAQEVGRLRDRVAALSQQQEDGGTQALRAQAAERERVALRLEQYESQTAALDARIEELRAQAAQPPKRAAWGGRWLQAAYLALALLVAAASVACGLALSNYCFSGLVLTAGLCVLYMRQKDALEAAGVGDADAEQRALAAAQRERAMFAQQAEALRAQLERMDAALREMDAQAPARQEELVAARVQLETAQARLGDPAALRGRIARLEDRERALCARVEALEMAEQQLMQAARERQSDVAPGLAAQVESILARVTAGKYARAVVSQSLELSLQPGGGAVQPWEYFSSGTVEMMYLALRLSLMRRMEAGGGRMPAFLDDPFAQVDDARTRQALTVLREHAHEGRQVLLFTCQQRTAQLCPGARVIDMPAPRF